MPIRTEIRGRVAEIVLDHPPVSGRLLDRTLRLFAIDPFTWRFRVAARFTGAMHVSPPEGFPVLQPRFGLLAYPIKQLGGLLQSVLSHPIALGLCLRL